MTGSVLRAIPSVAPAKGHGAITFPLIASDGARRWKRTVDVSLSTVACVLFFPLACLIALAIWLESGGPILYSHERIGRGGRRFQLLKFRTMVPNGEEALARYLFQHSEAAVEWEGSRKLRYDPRVTRIGRFLRRTSLDEIPQLFNVLRGDMSLAGPRPIVDSEIRHYGAAFPLYALAYPGLTGLWQVSGRNDVSYERRVELDVEYVRNWSAALDFQLLFRTVGVVLRGKGAY